MKNKALAILLSAVFAFALWLYVITVVNPESEKVYYDIPVVLQGENVLAEQGLMIVSDDPKVTLALKSTRTILNDLNETNINVITNLSNIKKPGIHNLTYDISYPGNIPSNEIAVQSSSTDLITIKVEKRIKKTVPVVIDYGGTAVPEGYIADLNMEVVSVEASGPESVMNQVEQAVIRVDLNNQTETFSGDYQYALCDKQGAPVNAEKVTVNVEDVNLIFTVRRVKQIALNVNIISGGGATEQTSTITIDPMQIEVAGSEALLEGLDSLTVGTINLGEILEDQTLTFDIVLPDTTLVNLTGVDKVTVDIKFPQLLMKTFNVTVITPTNVPENMRVDMITKALPVTVRGPVDLIQAMTDADLSAVVDFSGTQTGTVQMEARIVVGETFAGVGAVGTYKVSAKVR